MTQTDIRPIRNAADSRPLILLTMPGSARDPRAHLGSADYSYGFVERAMRPCLEALGEVRRVGEPESRLSWLASAARQQQRPAIHLSISPPQLAFLPSDIPTVFVPFWEFPRVPDRNFGTDTRQNWTRITRGVSHIVCACEFTARAFRGIYVGQVSVIPVAVDSAAFDIPPWQPARQVSFECRHLVLEGNPTTGHEMHKPRGATGYASANDEGPAELRIAGPSAGGIRAIYRQHMRPWLSPLALERMKSVRRRVLRIPDAPPPRLPFGTLSLGGVVYLSVFNPGDSRKNARDMLTAFLDAFRDQPDVTLVWKLATNAQSEHEEISRILAIYHSLAPKPKCRVALIADYLDDETMQDLYLASTYYLNASRGEGACLPLQHALAAGRPAIAPVYSAMEDYIDARVAFPVAHSIEPTHWPHDPDLAFETTWARISWASLRARLRESYELLLADDCGRYSLLAQSARTRMQHYATRENATEAWRAVLIDVLSA